MIESFVKAIQKDGTIAERNEWDIKEFESFDIPILYLVGSIAGMTKDDKVTLSYFWKELSGTCTLKWQGNSSVTMFQKKNYTIKFDKAFEVVDGWGEQSKYCLKSNFNDPTNHKNLLCATLWGKTVKSRNPSNANLKSLPNGGAVDGFPIIISLNGEFHGLYTWNIPKDAWLFGMTDTTKQQAIVCADISGDGTVFKKLADFKNDFELEYSSDEKSEWVLSSVNRLISAVMSSDGTNITYGITPYVDWDSVIDYYIHTVLTKNTDATLKNYIMVTFDGVKWVFSAYDMDTVLGVTDYGASFTTANGTPNFESMASQHALFAIVWKYMRPQLRARYKQVREAIYNEIQVSYLAYTFASKIPLPVSIFDMIKHKRITASKASNLEQILTYFRLRLAVADEWIENTTGETALPEQNNPDVPTLVSISATYAGGEVEAGTPVTSLTGISVIATYSNGTTENVTGYSLSGTIAEGSNTITVSYNGKTTTITVIGVAKQGYTNLVPTSIDTDGTIFNGKGWIEKTRLSSSGVTKTFDYASTTGYMPASSGAVVRIKGSNWDNGTACYVCSYKSDFSFVGAVNSDGLYGGGTVTREGDISIVTLTTNNEIAYVRVSAIGNHSEGPGADLIVTVNEEIT